MLPGGQGVSLGGAPAEAQAPVLTKTSEWQETA